MMVVQIGQVAVEMEKSYRISSKYSSEVEVTEVTASADGVDVGIESKGRLKHDFLGLCPGQVSDFWCSLLS